MKALIRSIVIALFFIGIQSVNVVKAQDDHNNIANITKNVTKEVLSNGMTLLMYRNPAVPKVLVQVAYNIGSYVEGAGERGLAHLLEHMIFKGTKQLSESDIDAISRKFGASYNAFTSHDMTSYYFETNKNNWEPFVQILADCMQNARFDEQHLASELWAVIQELKMNKDNYWRMMLEKIISSLFSANHPYHVPIIGYKEDLLDLSGARLKKFYDKYYHPDHATLVVVGDIDPVEVSATVNKYFGQILAKKTVIDVTFPSPSHDLVTIQSRFYEDIKNQQLAFYWRIPGLKDKQELVSTVAAFLLGSGENSRLYKALVDDHQVAASVGVIPYKFMEEGIFCIFIEPLAGKTDECKKIVQEEITRAVKEGFKASELSYMVQSQKKAFFKKLEGLQGLAYEWISSFFSTGDEFALFTKNKQFENITSASVQDFMLKYLDPFVINSIEVLPMPDGRQQQVQESKKKSDDLDKKILTSRPRTSPTEEHRFVKTMSAPKHLDFDFPKPNRVLELDNGLTVMLYSNRNLPLISLNCRFKDAAYHTQSKDNTMLDMMMGMLIEGSDGYTKHDNVDFFDTYGADYSFTDAGASLSLLSDEYESIFKRFLHVLLQPTFPADALEKTREIIVDSCSRMKDNQSSVAFRQLTNCLYPGHPYAWTFDEAIIRAQGVTAEDLKSFHQKFVHPNNMIMSVVGDFDLDEMQASVKHVFGDWKPGNDVVVVHEKASYQGKQTIKLPMLRDQVFLLLGQSSPLDIYNPDLVPVKLLNYIAFHSLGSRLFKLREQAGLFYTASGCWANNATKDQGFDFLSTILTPDKVEDAEQKMCLLVNDIGVHGVTQDELAAAQQLYFKTLIDIVSTNSSKANLLCTIKDFGLPFDHYDKVLKRVQSMTVEELNMIAAKYFNTDNIMSIRVGRVN